MVRRRSTSIRAYRRSGSPRPSVARRPEDREHRERGPSSSFGAVAERSIASFWAAHELNGGGDGAYARGGPPALERWWNEQLAYLKTSLRQAPPAIRRAEALNERVIRTRLTPLT